MLGSDESGAVAGKQHCLACGIHSRRRHTATGDTDRSSSLSNNVTGQLVSMSGGEFRSAVVAAAAANT